MLKLFLSSTRFAAVACIIALVSGCGPSGSNDAESTAPTTPEPATISSPEPTSTPTPTPLDDNTSLIGGAPFDDEALLKRGKIAFLRCRACHTLKQGEDHLTGPNLYSFFGSPAGSKAGYAYSDELKNSGVVWSADTLGSWLASPDDFVKGNRMVFAGLPREEDRVALIYYLKQETQ